MTISRKFLAISMAGAAVLASEGCHSAKKYHSITVDCKSHDFAHRHYDGFKQTFTNATLYSGPFSTRVIDPGDGGKLKTVPSYCRMTVRERGR